MTTLSEYLAASGIKQSAFAASLGVSRSYMSEIVSGVRTPSLDLALKIQGATGGVVDVASLAHRNALPPAERPAAEAS